MTSIQEASTASGIPLEQLEVLLALPYKKTSLPRPMSLNSLSFARGAIADIRQELSPKLKQSRRDAQERVNNAFRLIMCNLVSCVFTRERLALPGSNDAYGTETYYHKLFLTRRSVKAVVEALEGKYIKRKKGNTYKHQVDGYQPTTELELMLIPLLYEVYEEYNPLEPLVIFKQEKADIHDEKSGEYATSSNPLKGKREENSSARRSKHIMRIRSLGLFDVPHTAAPIELETTFDSDQAALIRINDALKDVTYALKGPVTRIYSHDDPMQGGRLYVRLQSLPDKRARIRINTLFNGMPIAEVDLSANHPRMLMALEEKEQLPENFYDDIAAASGTSRDKVKFLVMKMVGASNRKIDLVVKKDEKDWYKSTFKMTQAERRRIEAVIQEKYPKLYSWFYKGRGINLQALEGDILLEAMLTLLDQGIRSLPMHDAIYVQQGYITQARTALENAWMHALEVDFKPYTKVDMPNG